MARAKTNRFVNQHVCTLTKKEGNWYPPCSSLPSLSLDIGQKACVRCKGAGAVASNTHLHRAHSALLKVNNLRRLRVGTMASSNILHYALESGQPNIYDTICARMITI
eukprot:4780819-Amphidinium_carterae.1